MYNPNNHYWIIGGDQDNVWSSARAMSVPTSDSDYTAWTAGGNYPTAIGSMQELQDVLGEQYPPGTLVTYNAFKRWQKEQAGITATSGMPLKTDDRSQAKINGVYLALQASPGSTTQWHAADGTYWSLAQADVEAMSADLQTHINNCFQIGSDTLNSINDGTITTLAQIDAAYNAPMKAAQKNWMRHPTKTKAK
jgi:hypothetical protein